MNFLKVFANVYLINYPILLPMVADDNTTVVRWGDDITSPLYRFVDENLNTAHFINENYVGDEFIGVGRAPGTSDDGRVLAFMANHDPIGIGIFIALIASRIATLV